MEGKQRHHLLGPKILILTLMQFYTLSANEREREKGL